VPLMDPSSGQPKSFERSLVVGFGIARPLFLFISALLVSFALLFVSATNASALPANFFGFQFGGSYPQSEPDMEAVARSGAKYWRLPFDCHNKDWTTYNKEMHLAAIHGISVIANVGNRCKEGSARVPAGSEWEPQGSEWETWLYELIQHYGYWGENGTSISVWEIWNEPNRGVNSDNGIEANGNYYGKFLKRSATALREAQNNQAKQHGQSEAPITVLMGGLLTLNSEWKEENGAFYYNESPHDFLQEAHTVSNLGETFNGVGSHPYAFGAGAAGPVEENITHIRNAVNEFFSSGKGIWITELGWPVEPQAPVDPSHERVSPEVQKNLLNAVFNWVKEHQAEKNIQSLLYYFYRDVNWNNAWDSYCGLRLEPPSKPYTQTNFRPSWYAYQEQTGAAKWPIAPAASTQAATSIQTHQATLNGSVNPYGLTTEYHFEWGTTTGYGNSIPTPGSAESEAGWTEGSGSKGKTIGLEPNTTYHYRIVATNENHETSYGADQQFTTPPEPPVVTTEAPTGVTVAKATLHGTVNPKGASTHYRFEWGTSESYGSKFEGEVSGTGAKAVEHEITGLSTNTTYYYRLFAENSGGNGEAKGSFKTPAKPVATTEAATYTNTFEPQLNATVNPERADTHYQFEYGETTAYGTKVPATAEDIGSGSKAVSVSATLKGLEHNKPLHFRVVATNEAGTTNGTDKSFTTLPLCKNGAEQCTWSTQTTPNPPPKTEDSLRGVSCGSATSCIAAGYNHYAENSFTESWNGTEWKIVTSFAGEVNGVSCFGSTFCMAVGTKGGALHYWKLASGEPTFFEGSPPTPSGSTFTTLSGVSCTSESACTAVGHYYSGEAKEFKTLVERWNGSEWSTQSSPTPPEGHARNAMLAVSCASSTSCATVGSYETSTGHTVPTAETWNGEAWTLRSVPNPTGATVATLEGVSCGSSSACMAVGHSHEEGGKDKSLAESWNGSAWSEVATPAPSESVGGYDLYGVSCLSPSSCFAVGKRINKEKEVFPGFFVPSEERTLAETWNGTEWRVQTTPNPEKNLWSAFAAVSCTSSTACTAAGATYPLSLSEESLTLGERYE
jgi:hypothetical protein